MSANQTKGPRKIISPQPHDYTKPYWEAANEGRLLVRKCQACDEAHHYPRTLCPFCGSDDLIWLSATGTGTIYSFSTLRVGPEPYTIAYVTLAEGPTMMTNLVECDPQSVQIGQKVSVVFRPSEQGQLVPMFKPE